MYVGQHGHHNDGGSLEHPCRLPVPVLSSQVVLPAPRVDVIDAPEPEPLSLVGAGCAQDVATTVAEGTETLSLASQQMESRASEVIAILSEIAEMSRAQHESAAELREERRRLAEREAMCHLQEQETQRALLRLEAEVAARERFAEEARVMAGELEEERQKTRSQRQAARRMRARYDRQLQERDEQMRKVSEDAECREQRQEAQISRLTQQLQLLTSQVFTVPNGQLAPPHLSLECVTAAASVDSARRRLFSPSVTDLQTSTAGDMMHWLFDGSMEGSLSTGSLVATSNLETLVEVAQEGSDVCTREGLPLESRQQVEPVLPHTASVNPTLPLTLTLPSPPQPSSSPAPSPPSPSPIAMTEPVPSRALSEPRCLQASARLPATSPRRCGSARRNAMKESPPRGCVAEKVSIFEQRCQSPVNSGVPAVLRRGPRAAPVPTPLGRGRAGRRAEQRRPCGQPPTRPGATCHLGRAGGSTSLHARPVKEGVLPNRTGNKLASSSRSRTLLEEEPAAADVESELSTDDGAAATTSVLLRAVPSACDLEECLRRMSESEAAEPPGDASFGMSPFRSLNK